MLLKGYDMKKQKKQNKYIKVKKDLFKEMIQLLYDMENHADFDFGWQETDKHLAKVKKVAEEAENIL